jgi:hypothetical protein
MKVHLAVSGKGTFGGTITTTLCGRMNKQSRDGMNSSDERDEVTCGHCKAVLADPKHWRYRKYLGGEE